MNFIAIQTQHFLDRQWQIENKLINHTYSLQEA